MKKQNQITLVRLSIVNLHVHNMLQRGEISQNTCNYLITDTDRTQQLYLLPKIHKDPPNPSGRPIVSGSGGPTEKLSQLVDNFIGQIVPFSQSYIRDSTHLINILKGFTVQPGMLLCTVDITSLYIMKVFNQLKKCLPFTSHLTACHTIVIS